MDLSEFELIDRIAGAAGNSGRFETGIGDDSAVIRSNDRIVTSVDTAVSGVHFSPERPAAESARKAVAAAVSDLAAMGLGKGDAEMLVALGAPPDTDDSYMQGLIDGAVASAEEFGIDLAGGDVVSSPTVFLSVTVIAHVDDSTTLVRRSGARVGDVVAVTGPVGGAAAGLALMDGLVVPDLSDLTREMLVTCQVQPQPQLAAAPVLARAGATAMIDVSDGLGADLGHIGWQSRVAIRLETTQIPLVPGVREVAASIGTEPVPFAVAGGEDYVLALTIPQDRFEEADSALIEATGFELLAIGAVASAEGGFVGPFFQNEDGSDDLAPRGHDHFKKPEDHSR